MRNRIVTCGWAFLVIAAISTLAVNSTDAHVKLSVEQVLRRTHPDLIVNAAAMHHVECCEQDPETAYRINALGPRNLATVAKSVGAILMHVSTDYVFDGATSEPYEESDVPRPLNVYGRTKLAGELAVQHTLERHFVIRTSALYGSHPCRGKGGLNFVELMLKLGRERGRVRVVDCEVVTPTSTWQLAEQMVRLSRTDSFGLLHATAEGSCSWYDFAREIFAVADLPVEVAIADPQEFPSKVPRPRYSVLENARLKDFGINCFIPWQEGLRQYFGSTWAAGERSHNDVPLSQPGALLM